MIVLTEHEGKRYREYLLVIVVSYVLNAVRGVNIFYAMGCTFAVVVIAELASFILGHIIGKLIFERAYPKSIREIKHSAKQYQYVATFGDKEVYSYVYKKPLEEVEVQCWKYRHSYLFEVVKKRKRT